jgi:hypothetical protein
MIITYHPARMIVGIPIPNPTANPMILSRLRFELDSWDVLPEDDNVEVGVGILLVRPCEEVGREAEVLLPAAMN